MNESVGRRLEGLDSASLAEAAQGILARIAGIDDPTSAAAQIAELAHLPPNTANELQTLAEQAGLESLHEFPPLMRVLLQDVVASDPSAETDVAKAIDSTGQKQIVLGPEVYAFCYLLAMAYVVIRTGGKKETSREEIRIQDAPDGRVELTIREHTVYLDPFGPLAALLKRIVHGPENS